MFHGRWPNGWGAVEVSRWFESNSEVPARFSDNAAHIRFARRFGGEEAPVAASANTVGTDEPHNYVLPNVEDAQPADPILGGLSGVLGYLDKPIDAPALLGSTIDTLVAGNAPFGMKGLDMVFGPDSHSLGGLPNGSDADILGIPPVI